MDEEQLRLSMKEIKALRVLRKLLPKIGKFNQTDWQSVMEGFRTEAGIDDEQEADKVMASLEAHGLATCNKSQSTPTYSSQTEPTRILFKGFITAKGIQFLRRENQSVQAIILSVVFYVAIGAILLVIVSLITGFTDSVSALWIGGLAGLALKAYNIIETNILSRLIED